MAEYPHVLAALEAEEGSLWGVVDALCVDIPAEKYSSAATILDCQQYLDQHGHEKRPGTIQEYRITGHHLEISTPKQVKLFRAQSVTTISVFANRGYTPEGTYHEIRTWQGRTERGRMPKSAALELVARPGRARSGGETDPEQWTPEQWAKFDKQVRKALDDISFALYWQKQGNYQPTPGTAVLLEMFGSKPDIDAELQALLAEG